jgi:uncharacterized protein (DUF433 family)
MASEHFQLILIAWGFAGFFDWEVVVVLEDGQVDDADPRPLVELGHHRPTSACWCLRPLLSGCRRSAQPCGGWDHRMTFSRITTDPEMMGGQPRLRGLRIPVASVVAMIADSITVDEIITELPDLTPEDVREALQYAAEAVRERELPLRRSA